MKTWAATTDKDYPQTILGQERRGKDASYPNSSIIASYGDWSRLRKYNSGYCTFVTITTKTAGAPYIRDFRMCGFVELQHPIFFQLQTPTASVNPMIFVTRICGRSQSPTHSDTANEWGTRRIIKYLRSAC